MESVSPVPSEGGPRASPADVVRIEGEARHQRGIAVRPGEQEHRGQIVPRAVLVHHRRRRRVPLGVVVGGEDQRLGARQVVGGGGQERLQAGDRPAGRELIEQPRIVELRHRHGLTAVRPHRQVVGRHHRHLPRAGHLEVEERQLPGAGVLVDVRHDVVEIRRVHVLGRVDAEPRHAEIDHEVEVAHDLVAHAVVRGVQIRQAVQLADAHVIRGVLVVRGLDGAGGLVEVGRRVEPRIDVLGELGAVAADARGLPRHGVEDGVGVDADADLGAALDHVGEFREGAAPAVLQRVADGLIALPPRIGDDHRVLAGRRDLDPGEPGRPQVVLALQRDVGPPPLEEVHERAARRRRPQQRRRARRRRRRRSGLVRAAQRRHQQQRRETDLDPPPGLNVPALPVHGGSDHPSSRDRQTKSRQICAVYRAPGAPARHAATAPKGAVTTVSRCVARYSSSASCASRETER